jgi:hypothetical protein
MKMPYKKTNEAWFGDSFNRSPLSGELSFTVDNCYINSAALEGLTGTANNFTITADCAKGIDTSATIAIAKSNDSALEWKDTVSISSVDLLSDKLENLQAQIDNLKKTIEKRGVGLSIRPALKTLSYTREL